MNINDHQFLDERSITISEFLVKAKRENTTQITAPSILALESLSYNKLLNLD